MSSNGVPEQEEGGPTGGGGDEDRSRSWEQQLYLVDIRGTGIGVVCTPVGILIRPSTNLVHVLFAPITPVGGVTTLLIFHVSGYFDQPRPGESRHTVLRLHNGVVAPIRIFGETGLPPGSQINPLARHFFTANPNLLPFRMLPLIRRATAAATTTTTSSAGEQPPPPSTVSLPPVPSPSPSPQQSSIRVQEEAGAGAGSSEQPALNSNDNINSRGRGVRRRRSPGGDTEKTRLKKQRRK